jgi:hypothetical protein
MSDIFVKFSYGCKNIDFDIMTIKRWFLITGVNILCFTAFVVGSTPGLIFSAFHFPFKQAIIPPLLAMYNNKIILLMVSYYSIFNYRNGNNAGLNPYIAANRNNYHPISLHGA